MKKILKYVLIIVIFVLLISLIYLNKHNDLGDVSNFSVYIECIDNDSISTGSGFVYKESNNESYIITNYHVIESYSDIYVYNADKNKIKANILSYDEYTDLAILTINDDLGLDKASIGNSDKLNIGDKIYTVGTPMNINYINTITNGEITNLNKKITIDTTHGMSEFDTIEIGAEVESGNSGGPLLNSKGEVIGVIFVKEESNNNIAFALPINSVMEIVAKLENNEIVRPNLGAVMTNTTNIELMNKYGIDEVEVNGVILLEVKDGYTLANNNLIVGDVITQFNNIKINNVNELRKELYKFNKGDKVEIEYYRSGIRYKVNVELE